jgi:predicted RNase H-like HicB family nuclease
MTVKIPFNVVLRKEPEGGYTATIKKLHVVTYGRNRREAHAMAQDAAEGMIESLAKH